jgi:hypothetical protein
VRAITHVVLSCPRILTLWTARRIRSTTGSNAAANCG